jgi:hypothetical protein
MRAPLNLPPGGSSMETVLCRNGKVEARTPTTAHSRLMSPSHGCLTAPSRRLVSVRYCLGYVLFI